MMFNTGFLHTEVHPLIYGASFVFGSLADAVEPEVICPHLLPFPPSGSSFWRWLPNIIWKHVIFYVNNLLHLSSKDQRNLFLASSISFVRPTLLFSDFKSIPPHVKICYVYYFYLPIFSAQNTSSIEGPEGPQNLLFQRDIQVASNRCNG